MQHEMFAHPAHFEFRDDGAGVGRGGIVGIKACRMRAPIAVLGLAPAEQLDVHLTGPAGRDHQPRDAAVVGVAIRPDAEEVGRGRGGRPAGCQNRHQRQRHRP